MIPLQSSRKNLGLAALATSLLLILALPLPLSAQSPATSGSDQANQVSVRQLKDQQPVTERDLPPQIRPDQADVHDPKQLQQATEKALAFLETQDKLLTKISISVRNASLPQLVHALRNAGCPIPIEVREVPNTPETPITLGVQDVSVKSIVTAVTALTGTEVFLFSDHMLIGRQQFLTEAELKTLTNIRYARHITIIRYAIAEDMKRLGKEQTSLQELSPSMQRIVQHIGDGMQDAAKKPRVKLPPDTQIYCKWEVYQGYNRFTLKAASAAYSSALTPIYNLRVVDMSKRVAVPRKTDVPQH